MLSRDSILEILGYIFSFEVILLKPSENMIIFATFLFNLFFLGRKLLKTFQIKITSKFGEFRFHKGPVLLSLSKGPL